MTTLLKNSSYVPSRGGHAPGDLRDAFVESLDSVEHWRSGMPDLVVEFRGQHVLLWDICGLLWNCTDVLPGWVYRYLEEVCGAPCRRTSYACGARMLRQYLQSCRAD